MGFGEFVQSNIKKSDDSNCSCYSKFEVLTETCLSLPSTWIRDTFYIVYIFLNCRMAPYFMTYKTNVCFVLLVSVCSSHTFWWYWGLNSQPWMGRVANILPLSYGPNTICYALSLLTPFSLAMSFIFRQSLTQSKLVLNQSCS